VKGHIFGTAILALLITPFTNPAAIAFDHLPSATILYKQSDGDEITVLVQSGNSFDRQQVELLSSFGTVTTVVGEVAVLHTNKNRLPDVAGLPFVSKIERSWPLTVQLDLSVPDIGANVVWDEVRDAGGHNVTGAGVVIGFVDTGIDVSHPDFKFPNGTTKILYVWDQTTAGRSPSGFGYGQECDSADIQAGTCSETDTFGHGTHVAGIAASSGQATGKYIGVAPGAGIIFVKSGHEVCSGASWTFESSQILDGINYIAKKASELGRRAVINLSLGGNIGGHDGSDPWEIALDEFVSRGTAVVVSAGNQALDNSHIRGQLAENSNVTFNVSLKESTTDLAIDVWYAKGDEVAAELRTPSGRTYAIPTAAGETSVNYGNVTAFANAGDLGRELYFEVKSEKQLPQEGWAVTLQPRRLRSNGLWDAWVDTYSCVFPGATFTQGSGYLIDSNITIGIPGTAHNVVTVGAYITKTSWKGVKGETFGSKDVEAGGIAPFSSIGPTRDGRIKPDVVAPGMMIASARSNAVEQSTSDPDAFHRVLAGTSMAAPHVAGIVALMFQYAPNLEATDVAAILRRNARFDRNTGLFTAGSPMWGFGKLDARTATGLYRLTLVLNGIPPELTVPVTLDRAEGLDLASGSWIDLYFPAGTVHTIALKEASSRQSDVEYRLVGGYIAISAADTTRTYTIAIADLTRDLPVNQTSYLVLNYKEQQNITTPGPSSTTAKPVPFLVALAAFGVAAIAISLLLYCKRRKKNETET